MADAPEQSPQPRRSRRQELRAETTRPTRRQIRLERELEERAHAGSRRGSHLAVSGDQAPAIPASSAEALARASRSAARRHAIDAASVRDERAASQVAKPARVTPTTPDAQQAAVANVSLTPSHEVETPSTARTAPATTPATDVMEAAASATIPAGAKAEPQQTIAASKSAKSTKAAKEARAAKEAVALVRAAQTSVMSLGEIGEAVSNGARESVRRRRELLTTPAVAIGSRSWFLRGVGVGLVTLSAVGIPMLLAQSPSAVADASLAESYVAGQGSQEVTTPVSLTGDSAAAVKSAASEAQAQSASNTCTTEGAAGIRAAFAPTSTGTVVNPIASGSYRLTSAYGNRVNPVTGRTEFHAGQDFSANLNTPIYAVADGTVIHAGEGIDGRSNNLIIVEHTINGQKLTTWYVHMYDSGVLVKEGDKVKAGQVIALVGSNGNSTGPHLHFEVHDADDNTTEPLAWLKKQGAVDAANACS